MIQWDNTTCILRITEYCYKSLKTYKDNAFSLPFITFIIKQTLIIIGLKMCVLSDKSETVI